MVHHTFDSGVLCMTDEGSDPVYRCLANEHRRTVLACLRDWEDQAVSLDDLVDAVVERETNSPTPDSETVAIELYHSHLPMLATHGVIDFDERTETIRYSGHSEIERILDAM